MPVVKGHRHTIQPFHGAVSKDFGQFLHFLFGIAGDTGVDLAGIEIEEKQQPRVSESFLKLEAFTVLVVYLSAPRILQRGLVGR